MYELSAPPPPEELKEEAESYIEKFQEEKTSTITPIIAMWFPTIPVRVEIK